MTRRNLLIGVVLLVGALLLARALLMPGPSGTGEAMASVSVPDLSAVAREGKILFDRSCASCHGAHAAGQDGIAPPLVHKIYEPNHHGDAAFYLAAKNGARAHHWAFGDMPRVEGITDPELEKIVVYVRELQRANGIL